VVIDAVMVQRSQPLRLTGRIQSVQWTSIYAASISAALLGGILSGQGRQSWAFAICSAMAAVTFVLTALFVKEQPIQVTRSLSDDSRTTRLVPSVYAPLKNSHALPIAAFLYLWTFNPFSHRVLYVYTTDHLGFSETLFGQSESVMAVGQMLGAMAYGFYCRRVPRGWLIHLSIVMGIIATGAYWWLAGERSAYVISFVVGVAYSTGNMVQLDLAARHCPPVAAGTMFALLMAVSNLGISTSEWLGGALFDRWLPMGSQTAFQVLVGVGCMTTACCWLLYPWLKRDSGSIAD
jgi:predicted MFS family arabinose efflux permease